MKHSNLRNKRLPQRDDGRQWDAVEDATEAMLEADYQGALYRLRDVIKSDPANPYAFFYAATALFELGRFDASVDAYRAALRIEPKYQAARVGLAHALRITGDPQAAIAEARRALDGSAADSDALFALGLAQCAAGDRQSAMVSIEAYLESRPEFEASIEARVMLEKLKEEAGCGDIDS